MVETDAHGHVPLNATFSVESDLFVGRMHNRFAGCPGTPSLEGKVLGRTVIQGRFKQPTPVQDMWAGQELLNRPLVPTRCLCACCCGGATPWPKWPAGARAHAPSSDLCVLTRAALAQCSLQRLLFTTAAKMFGSTARVTVEGEGDAVGYLNPMVVVAEVLHVTAPGGAPPSMHAPVPEDARLLDSRLADASGEPGGLRESGTGAWCCGRQHKQLAR